jgi:hypothetical protein
MNELIKKITELTDKWYRLIGPDHHKDRDCHWYIETVWSYGNPPVYVIRHYGYIIDEIEETWSEYELALNRLKELIEKEIKQYIDDNED